MDENTRAAIHEILRRLTDEQFEHRANSSTGNSLDDIIEASGAEAIGVAIETIHDVLGEFSLPLSDTAPTSVAAPRAFRATLRLTLTATARIEAPDETVAREGLEDMIRSEVPYSLMLDAPSYHVDSAPECHITVTPDDLPDPEIVDLAEVLAVKEG